jgi:hypothetical protein
MKINRAALYLTIFISHFFLITNSVKASEEKAYELYLQAEQLFANKNYPSALDLYKRALDEHDANGEIELITGQEDKLVSFGRITKTVTEYQTEKKEYIPKTRISFIKVQNMSQLTEVDKKIPKGQVTKNNAVAIIIGNQNYKTKGIPSVKYAINDVKTIKKYLTTAMGYQENNIIDLEDATNADFRKVFGTPTNFKGRLYDLVKDGESDIFIYYSGHGAPDVDDQKAYFVPSDADPGYISTTGYSLDILYNNLKKLKAAKRLEKRDMLVVIDSCFSGGSDAGFLLKNISPALVKFDMPTSTFSSATIMTSAGKEEVSSWYPEMGHSLFTYYFLKGLSGESDKNHDKKITSGELNSYLANEVPYMARRLNGKNQNPTYTSNKDVVIAVY